MPALFVGWHFGLASSYAISDRTKDLSEAVVAEHALLGLALTTRKVLVE
jgi:hypothetical protein